MPTPADDYLLDDYLEEFFRAQPPATQSRPPLSDLPSSEFGTPVPAPQEPMLPGGIPAPERRPEDWFERLPRANVGERGQFFRGELDPDTVVRLLRGDNQQLRTPAYDPNDVMNARVNGAGWWDDI